MRLRSGQRLGYCSNVHPYEDLTGLLAALESGAAPLRARLVQRGRLGEREALGVGLWLPARVAEQVARDPLPLRGRLDALGLSCFTVNAFPYGDFHGARVKDEVFRPHWGERRRLDYTLLAAQALAALLPEGESGSMSTHSGGYKPWGAAGPRAEDVAASWRAAAEGLAALEARTGRSIRLCIEPEPLSTLETTDEVVEFFSRRLAGSDAVARHLGVCFDACHMAVEFEDAGTGLAALARAGIRVGKVQVSAGLRVRMDPGNRELVDALRPFAEGVYLHQVVERRDGGLTRYVDLPEALEAARRDGGGAREWRIHFHVPLFREELGPFASTQDYLRGLLGLLRREAHSPHLEVETYTWDVLPEAYRREDIAVAVARELHWVLEQLGVRL